MDKKGQATVFVVLGVVIIVVIGMLFFLRGDLLPRIQVPGDFNDVEEAIQSCIDDALVKTKDHISVRRATTLEGFEDAVKQQFSLNLNCIDELRPFTKSMDILIEGSKLEVEVQAIGENVNDLTKIFLTVTYPIRVTQGENVERFDTFTSEYNYAG